MTSISVPRVAKQLRQACTAFVASLSEVQRVQVLVPFEAGERFNWDFRPLVPWKRDGLQLMNMTAEQRDLLFGMLAVPLSDRALRQMHSIFQLEPVARDLVRDLRLASRIIYDPEMYAATVFGAISEQEPLMVRLEGHHISVHVSVLGDMVSVTPFFLGAYPASFRSGGKVESPLGEEELRARAILEGLSADQMSRAVVSAEPPPHLISYRQRFVSLEQAPVGLPMHLMGPTQQEGLRDLIKYYLTRTAAEYADQRWAIAAAELDEISLAWAGSPEVGQPHYYSIVGRSFWLEYDKTQDGGNHVHTVWRDFDGDWGADFLGAHYRSSHAERPFLEGGE